MPLFNVDVTMTTTMVVEAADHEEAYWVAKENARQAFEDDFSNGPQVLVTGSVEHERHLLSGWDGDCLPYGGDGKTRLRDLLPPNAEVSGAGTASAGPPG